MSKSKGTDIVTIALLGALGVGGFLIFKNRKEIGNFFGGIGEGVQDFTDGIGDWYGKTVKGIQEGVDDVGKNVGGFFDGIVKGATGFFEDLSGSYVNFIGGAGKGLEDTVTGIQKGAAEFADNVGNFFGGIADGITDFFSGKRIGDDITPAKEIYDSAAVPITDPKLKAKYGEGAKRIIGLDGRPPEERGPKVEPLLSNKDLKSAISNSKAKKNLGEELKELIKSL